MRTIYSLMFLVLAACASGGDEPPPAMPHTEPTAPPAAFAVDLGSNRAAVVGQPVSLAGTVTGATPDGYFLCWAITKPAGSTAVLSVETATTAWFVPDLAGFYSVKFGACIDPADWGAFALEAISAT
jgi:hypothetical protein